MRKILLAALTLPVLALSSCAVNDYVTIQNKDASLEIDPEKAVKLSAEADIGDIKVSYGDIEKVQAVITYKLSALKTSDEEEDDPFDHIECKAEVDEDTLSISFIDPTTGKAFSEWRNTNHSIVDFATDLDIVLPETFTDFKLSTDVGEIKTDSLSGTFDITADVGNIDMKETSVYGDSKFTSDVGNVKVHIRDVSECSCEIDTNVGDAQLYVKDLEFESNGDDGNDKVGGKADVTVNGKGKFKLRSDVGNAKVFKENDDV